MQTPRRIDRNAFLKLTASAMSAGIWSAACSSDETPPDEAGAGTGATSSVGGAGGTAAGASGAPHTGAGTGGGAGTVAGGGAGAGGATGTVAGSSGSGNAGASARGGAGAGGTPGVAGNAGTAASVGGAGGRGGAGAGGRATGATGAAGGAGKSAGAAGNGVGGSAVSGPECGTLALSQNPGGSQHDHIPDKAADATDYKAQVAAHINGPDATMPFMVYIEGPAPGHTHVLLFTQAEIDTLRSGGTLTAKSTEPDSIKDIHIYTIGCKA